MLRLCAAGLRIGAKIRLGQDDDGFGAALPDHGDEALEAPGVEVAVEAHHQKHRVDVRRHDLLLCPRARRLA